MVLARTASILAFGGTASVPDGPGVAAAVALIGLLILREIMPTLPGTRALLWRRILSFATLPLLVFFSCVAVGKLASMRAGRSVVSPIVHPRGPARALRATARATASRVPTGPPLVVRLGQGGARSPVVRPGGVTSVTIGAVAASLVQVLLTFPGQPSISYYDLTDAQGHLTLDLRVPKHLALRAGRGDAEIVVQIASQHGTRRVIRILHISA